MSRSIFQQRHLYLSFVVMATVSACSPVPSRYLGSSKGMGAPTSSANSNTGTQDPTQSPSSPSPTSPPASTSTPGGPASPVSSPYPEGRGAKVPWTEYQAENGQTNAKVIGPDRTRYDSNHIEAEAIGRKAVRLEKTGDFIAIKAKEAGNSVVVRVSIPDAPNGGGIDSTLGLYVNGKFIRSLNVTSRYSWVYGGETLQSPNQPSGEAHTFFDETRALIEEFPAGAEIKIQRDEKDNAAFYVVDLIDLEKVSAPLDMPADFLNLADAGAKPDDDVDDTLALQKAIDTLGETKKKGIWIPKGTFLLNADRKNEKGDVVRGISLRGVEIRGAGMWYSNLKGKEASFYCWGSGGCKFSDFAILGATDRRDDKNPDNGFNGGVGKDSLVKNVWVEHVKVGMWVGTDKDQFGTDNLLVTGSRFRNIYGDGINFANGTRNSKVENSHFRNTGDDAMAMWSFSQTGDPAVTNNIFTHNTVQMPWRANCFAIYGGNNNKVEDSVCEDTLTYPGIMISNDFQAIPFGPTTSFKNMSIIRGGGPMFNQQWGAVMLNVPGGAVKDVVLENIDVIEATFSGLQFNGANGDISNVSIKNMKISDSGTFGVLTSNGAHGKVSVEGVKVSGSKKAAKDMQSTPESFFNRLSNNEGW